MHKRSIFWRGSLAIALTGIASPFVFALCYVTLAWLQQPDRSLPAQMDSVAFVWIFGSVVALPCALLVGLMIEVPMARCALERNQATPFRFQIEISVAVSIALLLAPWLLRTATGQSARPRPDLLEDLIFFASAGAIGGLCSACFWRGIVVGPALRRR